jgi:hypothetical protein
LVQTIRREYLELMLQNAKKLQSIHGSNYPRILSKTFQDLVDQEAKTGNAESTQ